MSANRNACTTSRAAAAAAALAPLRVLLLENISQSAVEHLRRAGFTNIIHVAKALPEDELRTLLRTGGINIVGLRSKTILTREIIAEAKDLLAIGCFCIGTNQVDLDAAAERGIPVFNSPFSNSRSVAELVICHIISLSRHIGDRNREMHAGEWMKSANSCFEIRGKTLGIVGYGHIGTQLSVLAEAMGLRVIFYDVMQIMPLGHAQQVLDFDTLLRDSDFVSLHVPGLPETKNMVCARELALMKPGAHLINYSRGSVVDVQALAAALTSGHLGGAAVDVFPQEPLRNGPGLFESPLRGCPNTLLTPHIGGSTEEAQRAIAAEVTDRLIKYASFGSTHGAVNLPEVALRVGDKRVVRVMHVHQNRPGVLRHVGDVVARVAEEFGVGGVINIEKQVCDSRGELAYLVMDVSGVADDAVGSWAERVRGEVDSEAWSIRTRVLENI